MCIRDRILAVHLEIQLDAGRDRRGQSIRADERRVALVQRDDAIARPNGQSLAIVGDQPAPALRLRHASCSSMRIDTGFPRTTSSRSMARSARRRLRSVSYTHLTLPTSDL